MWLGPVIASSFVSFLTSTSWTSFPYAVPPPDFSLPLELFHGNAECHTGAVTSIMRKCWYQSGRCRRAGRRGSKERGILKEFWPNSIQKYQWGCGQGFPFNALFPQLGFGHHSFLSWLKMSLELEPKCGASFHNTQQTWCCIAGIYQSFFISCQSCSASSIKLYPLIHSLKCKV